MSDQSASANDARVGTRDKSVAWYSSTLLLTDGARQLLDNYSKIPSEEVVDHVLKIVRVLGNLYSFRGELKLGM